MPHNSCSKNFNIVWFYQKPGRKMSLAVTRKRIVCKPMFIYELFLNTSWKFLHLFGRLAINLNWTCMSKKEMKIENYILWKLMMLERNFELHLHNKLPIKRKVAKPVWLYGIKLRGHIRKSKFKCTHIFQKRFMVTQY